jgi:cystathionine gamma-synthase
LGIGSELENWDSREDRYGSHIPPIYLSVVYDYVDYEAGLAVFSDRGTYVRYSREENPTVRLLERVLAKIEGGGDALAFNSGMSAEFTLFMHLLKPGSKVVVPFEVYSTTLALLEKLSSMVGFKVVKVWPSAESIVEAASRDTSLVFVEIMTNPTLKVIDLAELAGLTEEGVPVVVDNTLTTPILVKPVRYGASYVVHSITKYIAGHDDVVGGALVSRFSNVGDLWDWRRMSGTILQPLEAYLALRGLKTLEVRFERQSRTALELAEFLSEHPKVEEVYYPGLATSPYHQLANKLFERRLYGGVISFKVRGGYADAVEFMKKLKIVRRAASFGGVETLAVLPAKAGSAYIPGDVREKLGISENLVRLSVGLEDPEDLKEELDRALK